MIENNEWIIEGVGGVLGADLTRSEPSHIHIPRPSRAERRDEGWDMITEIWLGAQRGTPATSQLVIVDPETLGLQDDVLGGLTKTLDDQRCVGANC